MKAFAIALEIEAAVGLTIWFTVLFVQRVMA